MLSPSWNLFVMSKKLASKSKGSHAMAIRTWTPPMGSDLLASNKDNWSPRASSHSTG